MVLILYGKQGQCNTRAAALSGRRESPSLGAHFWFNVLKTLSSLRPIVATKGEDGQKKKREGAA
jgi:hypothetical protein